MNIFYLFERINVCILMKTTQMRFALGSALTFIAILIAPYSLWSEGTRQLAPNPDDIVMLLIGKSDYGNFAQYGAPVKSRLYIRIKDPGETVYLGLSREYTSSGVPEATGAYEFKIRRASDGAVVHGPFTVSAFNENVAGWSDAYNGPAAIDGVGYNTSDPMYVFNPDQPGDYYIEFNNVSHIGFWDITVAGNGQSLPGRVYSMNWAFRTPRADNQLPECVWDRQFNGKLFSYTVDGFVSKIDFAGSGFQGLSFSVAFNRKGPGTSGNLEEDRKSVPGVNLSGNAAEHLIFLSAPDEACFPSGQCGSVNIDPNFQCTGDGNYCLPVSATQPGQVEIVLDFNHNGVYDPDLDVLLIHAFDEAQNLSACLSWNGLRADGLAPSSGETVDLLVKYTQGVQHWALYDGEFLKNGFCVETIRPACEFGASSNNLHWDDRNIPMDSGTGQPKDGRNGCSCQSDNCRTWDNFNSNTENCDFINDGATTGYGDKNTLNTWWFASTNQTLISNIPLVGGSIAGPDEICSNTSAELTLSLNTSATPVQIDWIGPDGELLSTGNGSNTTLIASLPGVYTAVVHDDLGCETEITHELAVVVCPIDLELDKSASNLQPAIGEVVDFTITIDNYGPGGASGFSIQDVLPPGLTNVTAISNGGTLIGNTIIWQGLALEVGETIQLTYKATVGLAFNYTNLASVSSSNEEDVDSTPGNAVDTDQDGNVSDDPDDEDDGDGVVLVPQACGIEAAVTNILCDDNGTPVHPEDDRFTFVLTVTGANNSQSWTSADLPGLTGGAYNTPITVGPFPIADYPGGIFTFSIGDSFFGSACSTNLSVAVPSTCSDQCEITAEVGNIECHDNDTPSVSDDDFYTFQVRVTGFNTGTGWTASNGLAGNYGEWVDFGPFSIDDFPAMDLTFTDAGDNGCSTTAHIQAPPHCSDDCDIVSVEIHDVLCNDNNTPTDPADDIFTFTLLVTGYNTADNWVTSIGVEGPYNHPVSFGPFLISDGPVSFVVTDGSDSGCASSTIFVEPPSSCSEQCLITHLVTEVDCQDNGTPSVSGDDLFTFTAMIIPVNHTSTGWTASDGSSGAYGLATFGPFPISEGTRVITITDAEDPGCASVMEVAPPPSCSPLCEIIQPTIANVACDDNGTPTDPSDDIFTFTVKVSGNNLSDHWVGSNGTSGAYNTDVELGPYAIADGPVSFTVTDSNDGSCESPLLYVNPPATCSEQCAITHTVTEVTCLDNGTPYDPSDDQFEFIALIIPVNHTSDEGWVSSDGRVGDYGEFETFGPYPIADGPVAIQITDAGDDACTSVIEVNPPEPCSDLCLIKATVVSVDCDDMGTMGDPYDDTFTYTVEVTGLNIGEDWTASDGTQGTYGESVVSVPLTLGDGERTIQITDTETGCSTEIDVAPPPMDFDCPPDTDRGTLRRNVQMIEGRLDATDAKFDNIDSLCWLPSAYFNPGDHYYDMTSFKLVEVTEPKPFTFILFTKMNVGAGYPDAPEDMVDGTGGIFAGLYNFDDPCCFTQVAAQRPYPLAAGIMDNPTIDTTGLFQGNYTAVLKISMLISPERVYTLMTTTWLSGMLGDYTWLAVNNDGLVLNVISGDVTSQVMPEVRITQDLIYQDLDYVLNNRESFFSLGEPEFNSFCGFDSLLFEDEIKPWEICDDIDLERTFMVRDIFGHMDSCVQEITLRRPDLNDLVLPPAAVVFGCGQTYETLPNGFPSPEETGYPYLLTINGYEELTQNFNYNIVVVYKDRSQYHTGFDTTFIRQWTIIDQCDQDTLLKFDQLIKIGAFSAPIIECPLSNHYCPILEEDIMLFSTDPFECTGSLEAPWPVVTDTCGGGNTNWAITTEILFTNTTGDTTILYTIGPDDDRTVSGLPLGDYWFRYTLSDEEGHQYQHSCRFRIADLEEPTAICKEHLNISLNNIGYYRLFAAQVNHGSYDNCGIASIEVRRLYTRDPVTCDTLLTPYYSEWGPYVEFGCCDIGLNQIVVELRVTDVNENVNFCWLFVTVEDKTPPLCTGLTDQLISCEALPDYFNPYDTVKLRELFGWPDVIDNCFAYAFELEPLVNLVECGGGTIVRRFRAIDVAGNLSMAIFTQTITIGGSLEYEIRFPKDAVTDCLDYADSLWLRKTGCDTFDIRMEDEFLPVVNGECYNIRRTFHVINLCEYNGADAPVVIGRDEDCDGLQGEENVWVLRRPTAAFVDRDSLEGDLIPAAGERGASCGPANPAGYWRNATSTGYWTYTQHIRIFDDQSPVIAFEPQSPFCTDGSACTGTVEFPFTITEGCVLDSISQIQVLLDLNADGQIDQDISATGALTGVYPDFLITGVYPIGNHRFEVIAIDGCGNEGSALLPFSVVDCYVPDPHCQSGLIVNLQALPAGTDIDGDGKEDAAAVTVQASELASCDVSDCSEPLRFSVNRPGQIPDPSQTSITFTCKDRYSKEVEVYVWDSAGNPYSVQPNGTVGGPNFKWCEALIYIQDPDHICPTCDTEPVISGDISTEEGRSLHGVEVQVESVSGQLNGISDQEGAYQVTTGSAGVDYVVRPYLNTGFLDGVNTLDIILIQGHLLGNKPLESPYDLIAADVNRSGNITALDIIELRRLVLGNIPAFTNNTSWRFVDADYHFPQPANPWFETFPESRTLTDLESCLTGVDFVAVKIGDVNGSVGFDGQQKGWAAEFLLSVPDMELHAGETYEIPVKALNGDLVEGFQFTLLADRSKTDIIGLKPGILNTSQMSEQFLREGAATFSWNRNGSPQIAGPLEDQPLFTLVVRAREDGKLRDGLNVSSAVTAAAAYDDRNEEIGVAMAFNRTDAAAAGLRLLPNRPNPFNDFTVIGFTLPDEGQATLRVLDLNGREIQSWKGVYPKGYSEETFRAGDRLPEGIYIYAIETEWGAISLRMVLAKK